MENFIINDSYTELLANCFEWKRKNRNRPLIKIASENISSKKETLPLNTEEYVDEPLSRMFTKWLKDRNIFSPVGDVKVEKELSRSAFRICAEPMTGKIFFERIKPKTAELYKFKSGPMDEVLTEIDKFWDLRDDYKKLGLLYSRGLLLYGPPGSGKSSIINQVVDMITKRGDIVFYSNDVRLVTEGLKVLRSVEDSRKVVVVLEDADEQVRWNEQAFLHLLDGQDSQDGVLFLATTNYLENFPPRLIRSGRFDKKIEVPHPPREGRLVYLKNKLLPGKMETDKECERLADETDGFSFGDMLELVTAVYALKEPVEDVLERVRTSAGLTKTNVGKEIVLVNPPVLDGGMLIPAAKSIAAGKGLGSGIDVEYLEKNISKFNGE